MPTIPDGGDVSCHEGTLVGKGLKTRTRPVRSLVAAGDLANLAVHAIADFCGYWGAAKFPVLHTKPTYKVYSLYTFLIRSYGDGLEFARHRLTRVDLQLRMKYQVILLSGRCVVVRP